MHTEGDFLQLEPGTNIDKAVTNLRTALQRMNLTISVIPFICRLSVDQHRPALQ